MEKHCKICGHKMIPSAVGWLCPKCGNVEKMTSAENEKLAPQQKQGQEEIKPETINLEDIKPLQNSKNDQPKSVKHRVKEMFVPKIHDHKKIMEDHLLASGKIDENHLVSPSKKEISQMPSAKIGKEEKADEQLDRETTSSNQGSIADQTIPQKPKSKKHMGLMIFVAILVFIVIATAIILLVFADSSFNLLNQKSQQSTQNQQEEKPLTPEQTRDAQRKKDLREISDALAKYFKDKANYPSGADIRALYPLQYTSPAYIAYINYDPSSSNTEKIKYFYVSNGKTYILKAKLEDPNDPDSQNGYYIISSTNQ